MTNEEKANELARLYQMRLSADTTLCNDDLNAASVEVYERCLKMAEWKDQQFISMLQEIFDFFHDCIGLYDGGVSNENTDKPWFIDEFTDRILKNKS